MTGPHRSLRPAARRSVLVLSLALCTVAARAQAPDQQYSAAHHSNVKSAIAGTPEQRAARAFDRARAAKDSALELEAFLRRMPKGADLHMHLSGAIYAETFLARRRRRPPLRRPRSPRASLQSGSSPRAHGPLATSPPQRLQGPEALRRTRRFFLHARPSSPLPASTATISSSPPSTASAALAKSHMPEWLDEVATRAAAQNEQYLEVMVTPSFSELAPLLGTRSAGLPRNPALPRPARRHHRHLARNSPPCATGCLPAACATEVAA